MRRLKRVDPNLRIALSGFHPAHFLRCWDEMETFIRNGDIRHLMLPIQSAADRILELMNRGYSRADIARLFTFLNDVGFTEFETHLILGFPSETDAEADASVEFVLRHRPRYVLASSFMEAPGIPAARLPGTIDAEVRFLRTKRAGERIRAAGILCNSDDSELSVARRRALARIRDEGELE